MSLRFLQVVSMIAAFGVGGTALASGNVTPLPEDGTVIERIAFGSCADETLPQPIWESVSAAMPDLFLFVGDNIYADYQNGSYIGDASPDDLARSYKMLAAREDFSAFRRETPILAVYDDHDFGRNDGGSDYPHKQSAKDQMLDFFPAGDAPEVRGRPGAYHSVMLGTEDQRVQIILLDTRWFRSALKVTDDRGAKGKERYLPDPDPNKTLLGDAQWAWLEKTLQVPADVRLLVSSIQVLSTEHGWESWSRLPAERQRLLDLLESTGADNTVILSGDRHVGGLYQLQMPSGDLLPEITSSSLNRSFVENPTETDALMVGTLYGPVNFGMVHFDWKSREVALELLAEDGMTARRYVAPFAN